jgi:hypothetical protein
MSKDQCSMPKKRHSPGTVSRPFLGPWALGILWSFVLGPWAFLQGFDFVASRPKMAVLTATTQVAPDPYLLKEG